MSLTTDQKRAYDILCQYFCYAKIITHKFPHGAFFIGGEAGTGKTFLLMYCCHYLDNQWKHMVNPPYYEITSLTANRSIKLGGIHIHALFGFKVRRGYEIERFEDLFSDSKIYFHNNPEKYLLLQKLEVLFIDEFSLVGLQTLLAIDHVLKYVKGKNIPFGGIY